jgi:thymidine phosphorylase
VLARSAGNALEVREAMEILTGAIDEGGLLDVTRALAAEMLVAGGLCSDRDSAERRLAAALESGRAAERFAAMVRALGGPGDLLERPDAHLDIAPVRRDVGAEQAGFVHGMDVRALGLAVVELGGGRRRSDDRVDPAVGLDRVARIGDEVGAGAPLAVVHARDAGSADRAANAVRNAFRVGDSRREPPPRVHRRIGAHDRSRR